MRNFVQPGKVITVVSPAAKTSGDGVIVGSIFGVATSDAASGAPLELQTEGVFDFPKASGVSCAQGDKAYFNNTNETVTKTSATGLFLIGSVASAAATGDATVRVRLDGIAVTAAP